jgi:hypothetical protein
MLTLVALTRHPYESRNREPGDEYLATEFDAGLLVQSGQARYKEVQAAHSQRYATRDLIASSAPRGTTRRAKRLTA